jgi:hypothetical protein
MPKQHTSIAEMARECAEHEGSMIVDIIEKDGETRTHAVATWERDVSSVVPNVVKFGPHHDRG